MSASRRLALTAVVGGLIVAAEALAPLRPEGPQTHPAYSPRRAASRPRRAGAQKALEPYEGEPQLPQSSTTARPPWVAAVRFVRDYAAWEAGRLARLPSRDATERVILLLDQAGRHGLGAMDDPAGSVRIAAAGGRRYVATSVVGNFLVGRPGSRWVVVSVPGD